MNDSPQFIHLQNTQNNISLLIIASLSSQCYKCCQKCQYLWECGRKIDATDPWSGLCWSMQFFLQLFKLRNMCLKMRIWIFRQHNGHGYFLLEQILYIMIQALFHLLPMVENPPSEFTGLNPFMPNWIFYLNSLDRYISNRKGCLVNFYHYQVLQKFLYSCSAAFTLFANVPFMGR